MNPFVSLTQSSRPERHFEDPVLIDGQLARRGSGPVNLSEHAAECSILDPEVLAQVGSDSAEFDGWADIAAWMALVEHKDEWAPHLTGFITCKTQHERLIFRDGTAHLVEGQLVYPDARAASKEVFGPGGDGFPLSAFIFSAWNDCGTQWEAADHEFPTLAAAVQSLLPSHAEYGLTVAAAAKLLLDLGLLRGTGVVSSEE